MRSIAASACVLLTLLPARALCEVIDRMDVVVGNQVITELELEEELRVVAFLNEQPLHFDAGARRAAVHRLVDQKLIEREMELSQYPSLDAEAVDAALGQLEQSLGGNFSAKLAAAQLSVSTLRRHLAVQLATLRFVAFRFRPEPGISEADVQEEYSRQMAEWATAHPQAAQPTAAQPTAAQPTYDTLRQSIRRTLIQARTEEALNAWLMQARKQVTIQYLDGSLQENPSDGSLHQDVSP